ncbi:META domain-containing protein [Aequorivita sp. H23M31]|uniref:META domain-containing protein n=1 Tax=Aequorivita ciconiae TaxID=2494375 RepID=A0A410G434_9FLAO|nr:META domain-containing protein [Aequorivita sp. H23M31]QAA82042.1 META domain-containing protein [Aequorivita sp. H23M31]
MKIHFIAFVLVAFALGSCTSTKNTVSTEPTGPMIDQNTPFVKIPTETFWKLETLEGKDVSSFKRDGQEVGFTMFADNKRISGYAGCNSFFGTYKMEPGNRISFSEIGATKMMCPDEDFNENDFLEVFGLADNYTLRGNRLELNVGRRAPLAVFVSTAIPLNPVVKKHWKLKTLDGKKVKMEKNQKDDIFFTLNPQDNTVTGFAGCNTFGGNYELKEDNKIYFSKIISTLMACPDLQFNEWEYLKVFENANTYRIRGKKLEILGSDNTPLAVFEEVD